MSTVSATNNSAQSYECPSLPSSDEEALPSDRFEKVSQESQLAWHKSNLYDAETDSYFIPYHLWTGALWRGDKAQANHQVDRWFMGNKHIEGPLLFSNHRNSGKDYWVYPRCNGAKLQHFAFSENGIARVHENRDGRVTDYEGGVKFPAGFGWQVGVARHFDQKYWSRGRERERSLAVVIDELRFDDSGFLQEMTYTYIINGVPNHRYTYSPNKGMTSATELFYQAPQATERYQTDLAISGTSLTLPLISNYPLDKPLPQISRVIIAIHGIGKNPDKYFDRAVEAVRLGHPDRPEETLTENTLVIAPLFGSGEKFEVFTNAVWDNNRWRRGNESLPDDQGNTVSSYDALDELLRFVSDENFITPDHVTLLGHSAGGQMVQRYAGFNSLDESLKAKGIKPRYIVANPSSYVYPFAERYDADSKDWRVPTTVPGYHDYKYGLDAIEDTPYVFDLGAEEFIANYPERDVTYLLGKTDTNAKSRDSDRTPQAYLQGQHRLERGQHLLMSLDHFYPQGHQHDLVEVQHIGHSSRALYLSEEGRRAIFED